MLWLPLVSSARWHGHGDDKPRICNVTASAALQGVAFGTYGGSNETIALLSEGGELLLFQASACLPPLAP